MRSKLYPLRRALGSKQCKKRRCKVCTNVTEIDSSSSTMTGETFHINHKLNCDDKCLIYLFKFKVCKKRYVGETKNGLRLMWNDVKSAV